MSEYFKVEINKINEEIKKLNDEMDTKSSVNYDRSIIMNKIVLLEQKKQQFKEGLMYQKKNFKLWN